MNKLLVVLSCLCLSSCAMPPQDSKPIPGRQYILEETKHYSGSTHRYERKSPAGQSLEAHGANFYYGKSQLKEENSSKKRENIELLRDPGHDGDDGPMSNE